MNSNELKNIICTDISVIPQGMYCYTITENYGRVIHTKHCPYWYIADDKDQQECGYCAYLGEGDWENGGLLWDGVKECGINDDCMEE